MFVFGVMCRAFGRGGPEDELRTGQLYALHSKAGKGESSIQKSPVVTVRQEALLSNASLEHENRAQMEVMAWVEEGIMPRVQLIMPPVVGHNIVPWKQADKGNTVAPAEPETFVAKDMTRRDTSKFPPADTAKNHAV